MLLTEGEFWVRVGRVTCRLAVTDAMLAVTRQGCYVLLVKEVCVGKLTVTKYRELHDQIWMGWLCPFQPKP